MKYRFYINEQQRELTKEDKKVITTKMVEALGLREKKENVGINKR